MIKVDKIENFRQLNKLKKYIDGIDGFIAGGVFKNIFNNEPIKDVDIFFENEENVFKEGPEIRVGGIGCRLGEDETPEKYRTWISGFYTGLDAK